MAVTPDLTTTINPVEYEPTESYKHEIYTTNLIDGYEQLALGGSNAQVWSWKISKTNLTETQKNTLVSIFTELGGSLSFIYTPREDVVPKSSYVCSQWSVTPIAPDMGNGPTLRQIWKFEATFDLDVTGECPALLIEFNEITIKSWLNNAINWLNTYTRSELPLAANEQYLIVNAFHDVLGRGGYFPGSVGTTEAMFIVIIGCCRAYQQTQNNLFLTYAINVANSALNYLYPKNNPSAYAPEEYFLPHWTYNVKEPYPTKGKRHPTDYFKDGYFDQTVNFTNGIGVIPATSGIDGSRLSNVYLVHNGKLWFQSVYSPIINGSGQTFEIDYWVTNYLMTGLVVRYYPTTEASAGTEPIPTGEAVGTIKLKTNFTGQLKVVYSAYTTEYAQTNDRVDHYPMWRITEPTEFNHASDVTFWCDTAYSLLYEITNDSKWLACYNLNKESSLRAFNVPNLTLWFKKDSENTDPYSYAGTQTVSVRSGVVVTDNYTVSRVQNVASNLNGFIRINYQSTLASTFPSIEFIQNYAAQFIIDNDTKIRAEVATSLGYLYEVSLSTSTDAFDFSKIFTANWLIDGNSQPTTKNFEPEAFVRWGEPGKHYLVWHPTIVDFPNPLYTYADANSSATKTRVRQDIVVNGKTLDAVAVWQATLIKNSGTFAGFGYVISEGKKIKNPPRFFYRITGDDVVLKIIDGQGNEFTKQLTATDGWVKRSFEWDDFEGNEDPSSDGFIQNIQFELHPDSDNATVYTYWIAENTRNEPQLLSDLLPVKTYKGSIAGRIPGQSYSFWVGDFKPVNSPSEALAFSPGVVPFTVNIENSNIDAWRGAGIPIAGYQSLLHYTLWGTNTELNNTIQFLKASQAAYSNRLGFSGPFAPAYTRLYWDSNDYVQKYGVGQWIWDSPDPNMEWANYCYRPMAWAAEAYYLNGNKEIREILRKFLVFIDSHFLTYSTNRVPTNIPSNSYPQTLYHEPHAAALVLRTALYCNLTDLPPGMTFRILRRCYQYIESQYVSTGEMAGTWSLGQPTFEGIDGGTYRQWFIFWHGEIIDSLSLLLKYKNQLRTPPCNSVL